MLGRISKPGGRLEICAVAPEQDRSTAARKRRTVRDRSSSQRHDDTAECSESFARSVSPGGGEPASGGWRTQFRRSIQRPARFGIASENQEHLLSTDPQGRWDLRGLPHKTGAVL